MDYKSSGVDIEAGNAFVERLKEKEVKVYTEFGKLYVEGEKETKEADGEFVYKGLAQRSFARQWTLADDTEVRSVSFNDGLLVVELGKIVPDHHARKDYL